MLLRLADLVEANAEELARLETLDNGKPLADSLSWDVPRNMLTKLRGVDNMRVNLAGRNLFIISGYNGFDPEVNNGGQQVARWLSCCEGSRPPKSGC